MTQKVTEVLAAEQNKTQRKFCKNGWVLFCGALGLGRSMIMLCVFSCFLFFFVLL